MNIEKIKSFVQKYKLHILGIVGLVVVVIVIRKGTSGGDTTIVEGTQTYSEDYLLQSQSMANALTAQGTEIAGNLSMQSLVNQGQFDLASLSKDTSMYRADADIAIAGINADASKVASNFGYLASKAVSEAQVGVANIQAGSSNVASEFAYKLGIDTNKAQVAVSSNQLEAAKAQASAAKSIAKTNAWGGVVNTFAQGWGGGYIASNAKGW